MFAFLFVILGIAALVVCLASLIALHFLPTGYNPIRDAVSDYGVGRFAYLYGIQAFTSGISGACLLAILFMKGTGLPIVGMVALGCYALSRMVIPAFPTDLQPQRTTKGMVHMILAMFTFTGIAVAAWILTGPMVQAMGWEEIAGILSAASIITYLSAIGVIMVSLLRSLRSIFGLVERCIYVGTIFWLGTIFIKMLMG